MNILLTGATGFIGSHVSQQLQQAGYRVILIGRQQGYNFNQMQSIEDWLPLLTEVDVVINAVGIIAEQQQQRFETLHYLAPAALFRACEQAGVPRVIQISALGADEQAFTPYQQSKKAADDVLRRLSLDWFVLRPSLVYGTGGKSSALFTCMAKLPVIPLVGDGKQSLQPIHVDDVVATIMQCLHSEQTCQTLDLVGPYSLSFADWLQGMRRRAGKQAAFTLPVPLPVVMLSARLGRYLMPMLHPDNIRMLQRGSTADVLLLTDFLGRSPRSVEDE